MADQCPYLEYRQLSDTNDSEPDEPRPFCTAAEEFVQPMRADICNRQYDLDPETDCEIFRDHEGLPEMPGEGGEEGVEGGKGGESG